MSDVAGDTDLLHASTRRSRRPSVIWLIPIVAVAIGAWLAWDTLSREGPTITVTFETAEGLQASQSQLKFRDIVLGTVQSLALSDDHSHVVVKVSTTKQADPLLNSDTQFWVVKPRLFAGNVSGLSTLVSGSYIGMLPGQATTTSRRDFVGREDPPVLESNVPGRTFLTKASRLGSVSLGSPVFFRDLTVGEVLGWDIGDMAESATIHVFVREPFDKYVNDQTRFWDASGLSVKLGGNGVEVQVESLRAIVLGGIAFDTLSGSAVGQESDKDHVFPLFANKDAAQAASYSRSIPFVAYFPGSVRGLAAGADVTLHGLKVGQVTDVQLTYDAAKDAITAPVQFRCRAGAISRHRSSGVQGCRYRRGCDGWQGPARDVAERQPADRTDARGARVRARRTAGAGDQGRRSLRHADRGKRRLQRAGGRGNRSAAQGQRDPVRRDRAQRGATHRGLDRPDQWPRTQAGAVHRSTPRSVRSRTRCRRSTPAWGR